MKNKRIFIVITAVVLAIMSVISVAADGDEVHAAKKIIAVVYDDSGTMTGDPAAYASYATQAMVSMLNEQDELYIAFMSDYDDVIKHITTFDMHDPAGNVQKIKNHPVGGGTPVDAIDAAYEKLCDSSETDETSQFWLLIITDGLITDSSGKSIDLQGKLEEIAGSKMNNGSLLNVDYLSIGSSATKAYSDSSKRLTSFHAENSEEISQKMEEIANQISGRIKLEDAEINFIDKKTVRFRSALPMFSISVLTQNSAASVVSAKSETELKISRNIGLEAHGGDISLYGNSATITNGNKIIPAGEVTITFSEDIDPEFLVIMYEPAIEVKVNITKDGQDITDFSDVCDGDVLSISMRTVVSGTDEEISAALLPDDTEWSIEYKVDGDVRESDDKRYFDDLSIEKGENEITASIEIPGFAPLIVSEKFTVEKRKIPDPGIETIQPDNLTYTRGNLGSSQSGETLKFYVTSAGVRVGKDELDGAEITVRSSSVDSTCIDTSGARAILKGLPFEKCLVKFKAYALDDGGFEVRPVSAMNLFAFLLRGGQYTVTVEFSQNPSITAEGVVLVVPTWADFIRLGELMLVLAFIFWLIYIFFVKSHFKNVTIIAEVYTKDSAGNVLKKVNMNSTYRVSYFSGITSGFLGLSRAARVRKDEWEFVAAKDGTPKLTEECIRKEATRYSTRIGNNIPRQFASIINMMDVVDEKIKMDNIKITRTPVYIQTSSTSIISFKIDN